MDKPSLTNLDDVCLPDDLLRLQGSRIEHHFFSIIFPWLFVIGLLGNSLNLLVLLSSEMRGRKSTNQRSNGLLVALAFLDILFFLFVLPHSLANFNIFASDNSFRLLYFPMKMHLVAMANWCSAAAIWLVIVICAERLVGVRSMGPPQSQSRCLTCLNLRSTVLVILIGTGLLTSYNHFSHRCIVKILCHGEQVVSKCFDILQRGWPGNNGNETLTSPLLQSYVQWSKILNALLVILFPILMMAAMNIALLMVVRKRSFLVYSRLNCSSIMSSSTPEQQGGELTNSTHRKRCFPITTSHQSSVDGKITTTANKVDTVDGSMRDKPRVTETTTPSQQIHSTVRRSIDQTMQFQAEHRCTVTVCAIVTCFSLTQGPSAIMLSISFLSGHKPTFVNNTPWWYNANTITGFLVIFGKTLNFALFCLSSTTFRRRLMRILKRKFPRILCSKAASPITCSGRTNTREVGTGSTTSSLKKRDDRKFSTTGN